VSDEEFLEEGAEDSLPMDGMKGSPSEVHKEENKQEVKPEDGLKKASGSPAADSVEKEDEEEEEQEDDDVDDEEDDDKKRQTEEKDSKEGTETESSSTPAVNEWEHFDMVSIPVRMVETHSILTSMLITTFIYFYLFII